MATDQIDWTVAIPIPCTPCKESSSTYIYKAAARFSTRGIALFTSLCLIPINTIHMELF
jgi:hypothetical protein